MVAERCRTPGCGAEVIFVRSATSEKSLILDAKPTKGVLLWDGFNGEPAKVKSVPPERLAEYMGQVVAKIVDVYTDHHASCIGAKAWAGRTRKDPPPFPADPRELLGEA
jgi:hypothetical protein